MERKKLTAPIQSGTPIDRAARLGYERLFLYLAFFLVGGAVMAWGLLTGALSSEGRHMVLLGIASMCLCVFAVVFFATALVRKRGQGSGKLSK